jgi:uncharacterized protein (DUF983 family)
MFLKKGQKLYAIARHKCPHCHEGDLYKTPLWSFKKPFEMLEECRECGQPYVLEPGFYWGAMYVAYALSGFVMLSGMALGLLVFDNGIIETFIPTVIVLVLLYVPIFRLARSIWINIFVHYEQGANDSK